MFKFVVVGLLIASVVAFPQQQASSNPDATATVIANTQSDDGAGNFAYNYETSNQIKADAKGQLKQITNEDGSNGQGEVQQGEFSYVGPDGNTYQVKWIADENGFQPQGAHLPTPVEAAPAAAAQASG